MSELIDNSTKRKKRLKELILKLHDGEAQESVRKELEVSLSSVPYGDVVEVEQELIAEGLPEDEILRLCDVHSAVLKDKIDLSMSKKVPDGHPVDTIYSENKAILEVCLETENRLNEIDIVKPEKFADYILLIKELFNKLIDTEKHYLKKEYLLFPFLEKKGITGPPKVMWGKHDEIRELLKGSIEILNVPDVNKDDFKISAELVLSPAVRNVSEMITKEEQILIPMALDKLTDLEWWQIYNESDEIGYCLIDPQHEWKPEGMDAIEQKKSRIKDNSVHLPSGSFTSEEILSILNTVPFDMTFVDKNDKVKYFSQSSERIFQRNRSILNRDVRYCHPPGSVHIVDKILDDFKSGKTSRAPFWIRMGDKFIHIEYFAMRNDKGEYLGTLEVSQDLSEKRKLQGEQRILSYGEDK